MTYEALSRSVTLENLTEGDIINRQEYIEKLRFFKKFSRFGVDDVFKSEGTYIVDRRYREFSEIGLHYYKYSTLIERISMYSARRLKVCFDKNFNLFFEPVNY